MARSAPRPAPSSSSGAASPGWAPFPVQDWSTYRTTESWRDYETSWSYPGSNLGVDPAAPGPGPRSGPIAAITCALIFVLLGVGLVLADGTVGRSAVPDGTGWLPTDGAAAPVRLTGPRTGQATVENGLAAWPEVAQSLGLELGETMLDRSSGRTGRLWRQTVSPADSAQPQLLSVYSLHDGIRLELDLTGAAGAGVDLEAFAPGLPILPVGVTGGQRWQATGTWADYFDSDPQPYTADFAAQADGTCLVVSATVVTQRATGSRTEVETFRACPEAGVVERTRSAGVGFAATDAFDPVDPGRTGVPTGSLPPSGAPAPAQVRLLGSRGYDQLAGTPRSPTPPFAVTVDQVVWPNQSMNDLLVLGVSPTGSGTNGLELLLQRRLHPGGIVLTATAAQSTVLATTTLRRLTAWSPDGTRRWAVDTGEVVQQRPVAIDPTTVLTVTITGVITAWDLATGAIRWRAESTSGVAIDPSVGSGVVVVADGDGGLVAYDTSTGTVRWSTEGDPADQLAVLGKHAVVVASGLAYAYDLTDGRVAWTARASGTTWSLESDGADGIWLTGPGSAALLDVTTGERRWRTGATCDDTTVAPDWMICWSSDRGTLLSRLTGLPGAVVDAPASRGDQTRVLVQGRLWTFGSVTWSAWAWTVS